MAERQPSRVVVMFGGSWDEREVSIASGGRVLEALRAGGLPTLPVRWDAGGWVPLAPAESDITRSGTPRSPLELLDELRSGGLGIVFNALHGGPGEDGTLQGLLELAGVPYTGAGVHGSAVSAHKAVLRHIARGIGIEVAVGDTVHREDWRAVPNRLLTALSVEVGFPLMVKPIASGSSCGVVRVKDSDGLAGALDGIFEHDRIALVERLVVGRELSIPVLGTRAGAPPEALPIVEIEPLGESEFFDYSAKYDPDRVRETVPAPIEDELTHHLQEMALLLHRECELGGCSRTDVILGADGPVLLETQTVPGFTEESLLPRCAAAAGIDFTTLCRRIIDYALSAFLARGAGALHGAAAEE